MGQRGLLFILSAPSGAGKSTLVKTVTKRYRRFAHSVSYTTRAPRPGEKQGKDYHFVDLNKFNDLLRKKALLEHENVHGSFYGTPKKKVRRLMDGGKHLLLAIDVKGAQRIARQFPRETVRIFILPPNAQSWMTRLKKRKEKDWKKRIQRAHFELKNLPHYDYCIINDSIKQAVADFMAIVRAEELRRLKDKINFKVAKRLAAAW